MRMYDIIELKKRGKPLSKEQIEYFVTNYTDGNIPDYQASALLMAICFQGMDEEETTALTEAMARSGDMLDLSALPGVTADKHSTGGVGDKTTLITAPVAAACGLTVAKMSGRGLGFTGGTYDKLESIPGFRMSLSHEQFMEQVRKDALAVVGQTGNLVPADKKLYALRDVTATVDCLPLIASSVMSKKLAAGAQVIVLDVKCGSGAFMKTPEQARRLADVMTRIGARAGRGAAALVTDMDTPLGNTIGNAIEVREAIETLHGRGPADLTALSLELAAVMLTLAGQGGLDDCRETARRALESGRALEKFRCMVAAQGGDVRYIDDPEKLALGGVTQVISAPADGWIRKMDAQECGSAAMMLGAGRACKEDKIDYRAGIRLLHKTGEHVKKGEALAELYTSDAGLLADAAARLEKAYVFADEKPEETPLIYSRVLP